MHGKNDLTLIPGDVLLCKSIDDASPFACKKTGYSHAAIYIGDDVVLDAALYGVAIRPVTDLLGAYDYLAVLRTHPDFWSPDRIDRLKEFAASHAGKKFNRAGINDIPSLKERASYITPREIEDHLEGRTGPVSSDRPKYFCSELVASALIDVGIIGHSAAILFQPGQTTPFDIVTDGAYGLFVGYLPSPAHATDDDWFRTSV